MMRIIILILLTVFASNLVKASECYDYHTIRTTKLVTIGGSMYFQFTEKDQNGFTYVQQENKLLKGIDVASYKLYGEDESGFVFADKSGVFNLNKNEQYDGIDAKFYKILNAGEGVKNINGRLFLLNGKWSFISNAYNKTTKFDLPKLPLNIVNVKSWSNGFYVKDDKNVYAVKLDISDTKKYQIKMLPGVSPAETVYYGCSPGLNEDYLADKNTMFSIRTDGDFVDITQQLYALGFSSGFNAMRLLDAKIPLWQTGNFILKKRDGASSTRKNPLTGEVIDVEYAYSSAKLLEPQAGETSYTFFKNHIYPIWDDNFSLPSQIKISANQLVAVEGKLFKGPDFYYMGNTDNYKIASINISANAKFYPAIPSYSGYLPKALVDGKFIYFIGERFDLKSENKKALTSKIVKQLGSFYLFNNALHDGTKNYPITADYESLTYLGSFVEVINGCAGDMPNTPQVEVVYHHFFKDADNVYYFNSRDHNWQVIETANGTDYEANDYAGMKALHKIKNVKFAIEAKVITSTNYSLLAICVVVLGLAGFVIFKKK
ncbi:hypothetical protein EZJ43_14900 [Pedobacter changchengzhani]|uniref:WG repeat-containing protein n=1 Tax=Pedobacter changchengzhani TaxID=2529274 RepID=A0A4R5MI18_9SPHI|nr:hypothetical protein [Pedobacter changchengzhani]TDG35184.1 hypothetical protein EZJ43_14900 [Pedobacter changchengzhani]